ncbi:hypothetical protein FRC06_003269 [Ceratobasidium sp. 370]|nr:hypothetical protein FRC06_003269 [Ceratobasidium sp. 370]
MASKINSCSPSEAEDEPELDDGSDSYSWRTPTPDAPKHGLGVSARVLPLSELIALPEFAPHPQSPDISSQFGGDVRPDGDMQPEDDLLLNNDVQSEDDVPLNEVLLDDDDALPSDDDALVSDDDALPDPTTLPQAPVHVEFLELLALQLQTHYGRPKAGVEYLLKSLNWGFGDAGTFTQWKQKPPDEAEEEPIPGPLSQSLETLHKRFELGSDGERYAVCPNMDCNILTKLSSLPRDVQTLCSCGTELMKQFWHTDKRGEHRATYKPVLTFGHHSLIKQLGKLLSHPDIIDAIRMHKVHVQRPGRDPDVKEDIQHGRVWSELKGPDGQSFFTPEGDEIGLILTLDW